MHFLICIESDQYLPPSKCRILSVLPHVAVPQPSDKIFRIDFTDDSDEVHIKWLGTLPNKCKLFENAFFFLNGEQSQFLYIQQIQTS